MWTVKYFRGFVRVSVAPERDKGIKGWAGAHFSPVAFSGYVNLAPLVIISSLRPVLQNEAWRLKPSNKNASLKRTKKCNSLSDG